MNSGNPLGSGTTNIIQTGASNIVSAIPVTLNPITGLGATTVATTSGGSFSLNTATPILTGTSGLITTTVGSVTGLGGGTLTVSGSSLENVVALLPKVTSFSPALTGLTVNGGNVVNASGTVVGSVSTSPTNATVVTFDPAIVHLANVSATLTDAGVTLVVNPPSGATTVPTVNLTNATFTDLTAIGTGTAYTLPSTLGTAVTDSSTPVVATP